MRQRGHGWVFFAALMLLIAGTSKILDAIWAFSYHGYVSSNLEGAIFGHSLKTYGWIDLLVGLVLIFAGVAVTRGSMFASWIGILASCLSIIVSMVWIPFYPVWALTHIMLAGLVIFALTVYGGEAELE